MPGKAETRLARWLGQKLQSSAEKDGNDGDLYSINEAELEEAAEKIAAAKEPNIPLRLYPN